MSKFVFVLGAGASAEAGAPVMTNFIHQAETLYRNPGLELDRNSFDLVIKGQGLLQNAMAKATIDVNNVEDLFTAFEMAALFGKLGDLPEDQVKMLPMAMKRYILETIEYSVKFPAQGSSFSSTQGHENMIHYIGKLKEADFLKSWDDITLITFNYDLCIETALLSSGIPFSYCIDDSQKRDTVRVLKLHGSINWELNDKGLIEEKISVRQLRNLIFVPNGSKRILRVSKSVENAYIVPPSWNKLYHHEKLAKIWREACDSLGDANQIFVFGYSFPESDLLFRYLYAIGSMGISIIKNFFYIDPNILNTQKVQAILGPAVEKKFIPLNLKFGDSFASLSDDFYFSKL
ncbi:hypothetical protein EHQ53_08080 [Leptospira langatensis]|uniref:Uncharacterized protein n=1 Tax=Leptospira langatensis TaxID=2484983 RepID=A0A5F1ZUL2_9LEPT|nr:SIR2 family protein [Leptospira langatensis]TGK01407.1 hypothetical protein EHO57_10790 [Leptospira langatensis]TGL42143.1 hypothetical protein EHQ53_08080 [Leptospira langatensis]